jgi:3-oxoacyl-[acyl-carrier-protein] synthase III
MGARIAGVGKALPDRILTNHDIEKMVDTSNEWIVDRTGIRERRVAGDDETAATLGTAASRMALETAGIDAADIDLVICASASPEYMFPATASVIQHAIGATNAGAFDVNAACAGFLSALATGAQFIKGGACQRVLVVGSEVLSRIVNWRDRTTCVLFGDGAGAVVLEATDGPGVGPVVLKSDGAAAHVLYARGPGSAPTTVTEAEGYCIVMDGREVFRLAVRAMEDVARQAMAASGLGLEDITYIVPHQANARIISAVARNLGLPPERVIVNVERYGNTSSASIPVALCEAWEEGRLHTGDRLVFVAFGGGLVWGASVVEWTDVAAIPPLVRPVRESVTL